MATPTSQASDGTSGAASRGGVFGRPGALILVAIMVVLVALLYALHRYDAALPVCGDQFNPPLTRSDTGWWQCPIEVNRHARIVGDPIRADLTSVSFNADGLPSVDVPA